MYFAFTKHLSWDDMYCNLGHGAPSKGDGHSGYDWFTLTETRWNKTCALINNITNKTRLAREWGRRFLLWAKRCPRRFCPRQLHDSHLPSMLWHTMLTTISTVMQLEGGSILKAHHIYIYIYIRKFKKVAWLFFLVCKSCVCVFENLCVSFIYFFSAAVTLCP